MITGDLRFDYFGKKSGGSSSVQSKVVWEDVKRHYRQHPEEDARITVYLQSYLNIYGESDLYFLKIFETGLPIEDPARRARLTHILRQTGHIVDPDMDL